MEGQLSLFKAAVRAFELSKEPILSRIDLPGFSEKVLVGAQSIPSLVQPATFGVRLPLEIGLKIVISKVVVKEFQQQGRCRCCSPTPRGKPLWWGLQSRRPLRLRNQPEANRFPHQRLGQPR